VTTISGHRATTGSTTNASIRIWVDRRAANTAPSTPTKAAPTAEAAPIKDYTNICLATRLDYKGNAYGAGKRHPSKCSPRPPPANKPPPLSANGDKSAAQHTCCDTKTGLLHHGWHQVVLGLSSASLFLIPLPPRIWVDRCAANTAPSTPTRRPPATVGARDNKTAQGGTEDKNAFPHGYGFNKFGTKDLATDPPGHARTASKPVTVQGLS
jgi:hypothetical protein